MHNLMSIAAIAAFTLAQGPQHSSGDADAFLRHDLHLTRYKTASVDLNGDGAPELLVYANGPEDCGSGGCDLYVLARAPARYRVVTRISVARLPVRVLSSRSRGWHDLGVQVGGGGILHGYEAQLKFDGKTYPGNPTVPPATPLPAPVGHIVMQ